MQAVERFKQIDVIFVTATPLTHFNQYPEYETDEFIKSLLPVTNCNVTYYRCSSYPLFKDNEKVFVYSNHAPAAIKFINSIDYPVKLHVIAKEKYKNKIEKGTNLPLCDNINDCNVVLGTELVVSGIDIDKSFNNVVIFNDNTTTYRDLTQILGRIRHTQSINLYLYFVHSRPVNIKKYSLLRSNPNYDSIIKDVTNVIGIDDNFVDTPNFHFIERQTKYPQIEGGGTKELEFARELYNKYHAPNAPDTDNPEYEVRKHLFSIRDGGKFLDTVTGRKSLDKHEVFNPDLNVQNVIDALFATYNISALDTVFDDSIEATPPKDYDYVERHIYSKWKYIKKIFSNDSVKDTYVMLCEEHKDEIKDTPKSQFPNVSGKVREAIQCVINKHLGYNDSNTTVTNYREYNPIINLPRCARHNLGFDWLEIDFKCLFPRLLAHQLGCTNLPVDLYSEYLIRSGCQYKPNTAEFDKERDHIKQSINTAINTINLEHKQKDKKGYNFAIKQMKQFYSVFGYDTTKFDKLKQQATHSNTIFESCTKQEKQFIDELSDKIRDRICNITIIRLHDAVMIVGDYSIDELKDITKIRDFPVTLKEHPAFADNNIQTAIENEIEFMKSIRWKDKQKDMRKGLAKGKAVGKAVGKANTKSITKWQTVIANFVNDPINFKAKDKHWKRTIKRAKEFLTKHNLYDMLVNTNTVNCTNEYNEHSYYDFT
jgi:hypothetical protein